MRLYSRGKQRVHTDILPNDFFSRLYQRKIPLANVSVHLRADRIAQRETKVTRSTGLLHTVNGTTTKRKLRRFSISQIYLLFTFSCHTAAKVESCNAILLFVHIAHSILHYHTYRSRVKCCTQQRNGRLFCNSAMVQCTA